MKWKHLGSRLQIEEVQLFSLMQQCFLKPLIRLWLAKSQWFTLYRVRLGGSGETMVFCCLNLGSWPQCFLNSCYSPASAAWESPTLWHLSLFTTLVEGDVMLLSCLCAAPRGPAVSGTPGHLCRVRSNTRDEVARQKRHFWNSQCSTMSRSDNNMCQTCTKGFWVKTLSEVDIFSYTSHFTSAMLHVNHCSAVGIKAYIPVFRCSTCELRHEI